MNKTQKLLIGRTEYNVEKIAPPPDGDDIHYAYKLTHGKKTYMLMRNVPNPSLMFPVGENMSAPKWWVKEMPDGTLKEVR